MASGLAVGVYPRVGGGTPRMWPGEGSGAGLSPRGRGNQWTPEQKELRDRSIPAWAGEPPQVRRKNSLAGLSPRGRGNHPTPRRTRNRTGSIPAWAGEPLGFHLDGPQQQVYPRVGGGTSTVAGTDRASQGLSPRGRGNRSLVRLSATSTRSIPAWAGEPLTFWTVIRNGTVYPRVGGGTFDLVVFVTQHRGLSPRGRGNPARLFLPKLCERSIPAWAGEP